MLDNKNIFLYPLSLFYGMVTGIRNFLFDTGVLQSTEFSLPVICVGNISVGGTGKTPHTEYLIRLLSRDHNVAVLSRGYKRQTTGFRFGSASSTAGEIGDEPLQILRKFPGIPVAVDSDRVNGVKTIISAKPETDVIILDDGFQHRRITPGYSILLTDFNRLMIRDNLMPYGSLRESVKNMRRADIILVTKTPPGLSAVERRLIVKDINKYPYQNLYFTTVRYGDPQPVFDNCRKQELNKNGDTGAVIVTGIANPDPFIEHLGSELSETVHLAFPDHHDFNENDLAAITEAFEKLQSPIKYIITTEKDAVRLREISNIAERVKSAFLFIPLEIEFLNDDRQEFDNHIIEYVRKNKGNSRISEREGHR